MIVALHTFHLALAGQVTASDVTFHLPRQKLDAVIIDVLILLFSSPEKSNEKSKLMLLLEPCLFSASLHIFHAKVSSTLSLCSSLHIYTLYLAILVLLQGM